MFNSKLITIMERKFYLVLDGEAYEAAWNDEFNGINGVLVYAETQERALDIAKAYDMGYIVPDNMPYFGGTSVCLHARRLSDLDVVEIDVSAEYWPQNVRYGKSHEVETDMGIIETVLNNVSDLFGGREIPERFEVGRVDGLATRYIMFANRD